MKHLKLFEEIKQYTPQPKPETGDYIFAYDIDWEDEDILNNFIKNSIGVLYKIKKDDEYVVEFSLDGVDEKTSEYLMSQSLYKPETKNVVRYTLYEDEMTYWSDNREELEEFMKTKLDSDKFNL